MFNREQLIFLDSPMKPHPHPLFLLRRGETLRQLFRRGESVKALSAVKSCKRSPKFRSTELTRVKNSAWICLLVRNWYGIDDCGSRLRTKLLGIFFLFRCSLRTSRLDSKLWYFCEFSFTQAILFTNQTQAISQCFHGVD